MKLLKRKQPYDKRQAVALAAIGAMVGKIMDACSGHKALEIDIAYITPTGQRHGTKLLVEPGLHPISSHPDLLEGLCVALANFERKIEKPSLIVAPSSPIVN